ncbi:MAG: hypothetical protein JOZ51_10605, partial [Chloroflexi bacterium]|nr:hypothetical protein [Chloroflexota bacterium]
RISQESELVLSPALFTALQQRYPSISHVDLQLKRGTHHNELTRFRYDVTLQVGPAQAQQAVPTWRDWQREQLTLDELRRLLVETQPVALGIARIPNARLSTETNLLEQLARADQTATVADLRTTLAAHDPSGAIDPETIWALGEELSYVVEVGWSGTGADGCFSAVFQRQIDDQAPAPLAPAAQIDEPLPWSAYANNPLREKLSQQIVPQIRDLLKERLPEYMIPSAFVLLDTLPLTPNGKLDRGALPAPPQILPELEDDFVPPRTPIEQTLAEIWADVLRLERVGINNSFFALGGDSIRSIQVVARANQAGLRITPKQMFQHQTIAELALVAEVITDDQPAPVVGPLPLTPIQRAFVEQGAAVAASWRWGVLLETPSGLEVGSLEAMLQHLVAHHDALTVRLVESESGWQQLRVSPDAALAFTTIDLTSSPDPDSDITSAALAAHAALDLATGPIIRAIFFNLGAHQAGRLLLAIHPLLIDERSWPLIVAHLRTAYDQRSQNQPIALPTTPLSFAQATQRLAAHTQSRDRDRELAYWTDQPWAESATLPHDQPVSDGSAAESGIVTATLDAETTTHLRLEAASAYRTGSAEILLTALARTLTGRIGSRTVAIELEEPGRAQPPADLSRTVGRFTQLVPLLLQLPGDDPGAAIKDVKQQVRSAAQHAHTYSGLSDEQRHALPAPDIRFTYADDDDQTLRDSPTFTLIQNYSGTDVVTPMPHALHIVVSSADDQLAIEWRYNQQAYRRATIEALATRFDAELRELIAHCMSPEAGGYTPSDFPLSGLDQQQIDRLVGANRQIEDIYPISPLQEHMLLRHIHAPTPGLYVVQDVMHAQQIHVPMLERAWQRIVDRHPFLRTAIVWDGLERPLQIAYTGVRVPLTIEDWRDLTPEEQQRREESFVEADRRQGFDLSQPMSVRVFMAQVGDNTYHIVTTTHYMRLDGWSFRLCLSEFNGFYAAFATGRDLQLNSYCSYRDYVNWLRQQDLAEAEAFWRPLLQDFTTPTPLVAHAPGGVTTPEDGFTKDFIYISTATTHALNAIVRQHQLTLNTIIQGAWALLQSRYTGTDDILFGIIVTARPATLPGIERMVGPIANVLPVRLRVAADTPLLSWLKDLRTQQVEAGQYEFTPLELIREWCDVPRDQPFFESYLAFQNLPTFEIPGTNFRQANSARSGETVLAQMEYPVRIDVFPGPDEIGLVMSYYRHFFDSATILRMMHDFRALLEAIAARPDRRLGELRQS